VSSAFAPLRGANQSFDLTFCPVNLALRAHCKGKKSVNSRIGWPFAKHGTFKK
jgi:hypothetical protein